MSKNDIQPASFSDFLYWINERHRIFLMRMGGADKPWSKDPIFQQWKFTNVYRQLDTGTIWLQKILKDQTNLKLIIFNVMWYRLFNWWEHAKNLRFIKSHGKLERYINQRFAESKQIFTSAHMTTGVSGEFKFQSYLRACKEAWDQRKFVLSICKFDSMEAVFYKLLQFFMVGKFVGYEMVCDLRFTNVLDAVDTLTWANVGPGAERGLRRLGMDPTLESMRELLSRKNELQSYVFDCEWPFELREIEHSLCEFDKYQRVKTGAGRPRQRYNGGAE